MRLSSQPIPETADHVKESRSFAGPRVQLAIFIVLISYWLNQHIASEHTSPVIANRWLLICSAFMAHHLRKSFEWQPRAEQALKILQGIVILVLIVYFVRTR